VTGRPSRPSHAARASSFAVNGADRACVASWVAVVSRMADSRPGSPNTFLRLTPPSEPLGYVMAGNDPVIAGKDPVASLLLGKIVVFQAATSLRSMSPRS